MAEENIIWNKVLTTVMRTPGVKVNRLEFLQGALKPYCNPQKLEMLASTRPYAVVSDDVINSVANAVINRHTLMVTSASTVAGLPGGLAIAATIPSDLVQYYYHVFVLSQKLAYLYGFPDFCDENGELHELASDLLTVFLGVMMGAPVANKGVAELSKAVAESAVTRLPRVALTKAAIYPVASQVARMVGVKLTKDSFARGLGKVIPIAGGFFSGGLTLATFRPGAKRLQKQLRAQKNYLDDGEIDAYEYCNIRASFVKADEARRHPERLSTAQIEAMVNMAKMTDSVSPAKYKLLEQRIAEARLSGDEKLRLLGSIETDETFDVDLDLLAADVQAAQEAVSLLVDMARADGKMTTSEKIYLNMTAQKLGVGKEQLDAMLSNNDNHDDNHEEN